MDIKPCEYKMNYEVAEAAYELQAACHGQAKEMGWWGNENNPLLFASKLMLVVSELGEAMEGDRKSKMDDHLPHRPMREVELADAVIRIFDLAGGFGLDLPGAIVEKLAYNKQRADHKLENRALEGGKAY